MRQCSTRTSTSKSYALTGLMPKHDPYGQHAQSQGSQSSQNRLNPLEIIVVSTNISGFPFGLSCYVKTSSEACNLMHCSTQPCELHEISSKHTSCCQLRFEPVAIGTPSQALGIPRFSPGFPVFAGDHVHAHAAEELHITTPSRANMEHI